MSLSRILKGTHRRGIGNALLQILEILSWGMQEVTDPHHQDLRADSAWSTNSGKIESRPVDFSGFRWLRAAAIFTALKGPEILYPSNIGTCHRLHTSLLT